MTVQLAGDNAAVDATIGQIELPADGPWLIHDVAGQVVRQTGVAAESVGGHFRLSPPAGDLTPDPRPSNFPVFEHGSFLGATDSVTVCPMHRYPTEYNAAGKATIDLLARTAIAMTNAPLWVISCIFGPTRPPVRPAIFVDNIRSTILTNVATQVGTLNLSEKATRITGIAGILQQDGTLTTAEELIGHFFLTSDDVKLSPLQLPFNAIFGAGLGALIGSRPQGPVNFIPVDIPVPGGARIDGFVDLLSTVTVAADVEIFVQYE